MACCGSCSKGKSCNMATKRRYKKRPVYRKKSYKRRSYKKRVYKKRSYRSGSRKLKCEAYVRRKDALSQAIASKLPYLEAKEVAKEASRRVYANAKQARFAKYYEHLQKQMSLLNAAAAKS